MDYVCNRCLFSITSEVEMAEEQEYLRRYLFNRALADLGDVSIDFRRTFEEK